MNVAVLVLCGIAAALAGLRWLRVAQREHYLAGAVTRFALRWWRRDVFHLAIAVLAVAGAALQGAYTGAGLASAVVVGAGPFGLSLRGRTSPLAWTRRLATVAVVAGAFGAVVVGIAAGIGGPMPAAVATAFVAVGAPLLLDGALAVTAPYENRHAESFVRRARVRLDRVDPIVVAITGSYGKTTTKGYVAHLLGRRFAVLASPRSYNNRAGLAKTVNELLVPGTEVLVAEMGTYGPGEIAALCAWLRPRVAVITAIGPVHLERFRHLDRTLAAKAEIAEHAEVVVVNADDERLARLGGELAAGGKRVIACSAARHDADVAVIAASGEAELWVAGVSVGRLATSRAVSAWSNVACAVGAAIGLGLAPAEILARLGDLPGADNRLQVSTSENGVVLVDDTFNANPAGARLALEALAAASAKEGRHVVVTPGMVELGPMQFAENAAFAADAASVADALVIVGATNRRALRAGAERAARTDLPGGVEVVEVSTRDEAVAWVRSRLHAGDAVLYENDLPDHYP